MITRLPTGILETLGNLIARDKWKGRDPGFLRDGTTGAMHLVNDTSLLEPELRSQELSKLLSKF
ncbi:hypothetical protein E4U27_005459 [Claviceps purpurea]|nr:hypothetical protein E4U27_005459 [Claviceps purpurea]